MKTFYEAPTIMKIRDYMQEDVPMNECSWIGGIAFHEYFICGCCGGVTELAEIAEFLSEDDIVVLDEDWMGELSEIICDYIDN